MSHHGGAVTSPPGGSEQFSPSLVVKDGEGKPLAASQSRTSPHLTPPSPANAMGPKDGHGWSTKIFFAVHVTVLCSELPHFPLEEEASGDVCELILMSPSCKGL